MILIDDTKVSEELLDKLFDELENEFEVIEIPDPDCKFFFDKENRNFYLGYKLKNQL